MISYFEPISTFKYQEIKYDYPKPVYRVSVDMGLGTYLAFVVSEASSFFSKYGLTKTPSAKEKEKILRLLNLAKEMVSNLDVTYTGLELFDDPIWPHGKEYKALLTSTSYSPKYWNQFIEVIERDYVPYTES